MTEILEDQPANFMVSANEKWMAEYFNAQSENGSPSHGKDAKPKGPFTHKPDKAPKKPGPWDTKVIEVPCPKQPKLQDELRTLTWPNKLCT